MTSLLSVLPVVMRRIAANGRLLAAVVIGAVLAAALMSTTAIYTDAIRDLGLSFALRERGPDRINVLIRSSSQSSREEAYRKNRAFIGEAEAQALGSLLRGQTWIGRSATFFPTEPGAPVSSDDARPRSNLQFVTDLRPHIRIAAGRLPEPTVSTPGGGAPRIEAALGSETAGRAGVKVGDQLDLHPFWSPAVEPVRLTVVGLIEPLDQGEPFWLGQTDLFSFPSGGWITLPFFVTEETYFEAVAAYLPTMSSDFLNFAYVDAGRINARNAEAVKVSIRGLAARLASNVERTAMVTELPETLQTFQQKLFFTRIPLLVLILQIAGIVLYYLFMVSTMLVERQAAEIALLKSRGATTAQVMQIYAMEGLLIAFVALAAGPPLAAAVTSLLGKTPPFTDLSAGAYLAVRLSAMAYVWALSGALLALAALLWPAYQATRRSVVQYKALASRPPKESAFTRYYLDMVFVAAGGVLLYQLNRRGGFVTERFFGDQSADPVLLLTPAFFILTVGIVFLRLFPLVLRGAAWVVARAQGAAILMGMWQLVRNPVHYSRLVLLLMLATAVGMFAASFSTTLDRSYADRAAYEAGAPVRLGAIRRLNASGPAGVWAALRTDFDAQAVSPVLRLSGSQGTGFERTNYSMLGIDPATFGQVSYFRGDFAGRSLGSMLDVLAEDAEATPGIELPAEARWLGLWVRPTDLHGRVGVQAKVQDAAGRYLTFVLGPESGSELAPGWSFVAADLTKPVTLQAGPYLAAPPEAPLRLQSVSVRFFSRVSALTGSAQFDELQVSGGATLPGELGAERILHDPERRFAGLLRAQVVDSFESLEPWETLQGLVNDPLPDQLRQVPSDVGGFAVEVAWSPVSGQPATHGLRVRGEDRPLAVFASDAFVKSSGVGPGDETRLYLNSGYLDVEVKGTFRLFPTLGDPRREPALLANGNRLEVAINRNPGPPTTYADEAWVLPGPETASLLGQAVADSRISASVTTFDGLRSAQQRDPLAAAGWQGMLFMSFAAILMLSAIGFLIYSYLTAQKRTLEFAVLRTMGFSRRQIAIVVGFEQVFVIGLGMVAGTLMGLRLGGLMIRYMGVTETGADVLPPMLLHVSWLTVASAWAILGAVFIVTIGIVVLLYSRLALHTVLRIGEA